MNISFDFNGVLDTPNGYKLAERKIKAGYMVYIVTALRESQNVKDLAKKLGIPEWRVIFTGGRDKWRTIKALNIDEHYDNNPRQIELINEKTNAKGILFND